MRLTYHADYALRMLLYLGLKPGEVVTVGEVSDAYGVSRNHLVKVAQQLGKLGYVEILRGKTGGVRLARPARDIRVGELVRQTEASFALVECFDPETNTCPIAGGCALRKILREAQSEFLAVLDRYTLADALKRPDVLIPLLSPARRAAGARAPAP
ncbi:MAG: Rrf2 family transcriptional regulator [Polyangiaceae bacterium]|nr:Rrf2 family transcriptional regulator [Polyangiaceae bacterium]